MSGDHCARGHRCPRLLAAWRGIRSTRTEAENAACMHRGRPRTTIRGSPDTRWRVAVARAGFPCVEIDPRMVPSQNGLCSLPASAQERTSLGVEHRGLCAR